MELRNKDIMGSLPLLASVLGRRYGVEVRIGGDTACTDGRVIHLPAMPMDCDAAFLGFVRGFIDHESAHIRHTDFRVLEDNKLTPLEKNIWNALEDYRVEKALAELYPGCRQHFHWLIEELFVKTPVGAAPENPATAVLNWVLYTVRSWSVPELQAHCDAEAKQLPAELLTSLKAVVDEVRQNCRSSQDCLGYARRIVGLIRTECEQQPEEQAEGFEKLLNATEDQLPQPLGEVLAGQITVPAATPSQQVGVAVVGTMPALPLTPEMLQQSRRASQALRTRLSGLLQAKTLVRRVPGKQGRLDPRRLHRIGVQDTSVFLRYGKCDETSTAVHLLIDNSGSMAQKINLTTSACHAVAVALSAIPHVSVGVTAFPAFISPEREVGVFPMVRQGGRVNDRFILPANNTTPLTESLWWVMQELLPRPEARKLLIVLTDGQPDCLETAKQAVETAGRVGIEVLGIGILAGSSGWNRELFTRSRAIETLEELPDVLFGLLQDRMGV